jgi:hypothetical protein
MKLNEDFIKRRRTFTRTRNSRKRVQVHTD